MYNVIYADPPWQQKAGPKQEGYNVENGKQVWKNASNQSRELPYPTMSIDEIAALPVKSISNADSHLYLWVTNKYLLDAQKVISAWGFKYSTAITWKKKRMGGGLGGAFRITHETLLFCRRGNLKAIGVYPGTIVEAKRPYVNGYPVHSKKPEIFAEIIQSVSPGPYLEMFARSPRKGWDVWGNEVEGSIII